MNEPKGIKPLGRKTYGSIGHLPSSRMGPKDHHVHEGQQRICTEKVRDKHDVVTVTEKVDGSNVGICRVGNEIFALGRAGYLAQSSPYEQHQLFADWVCKEPYPWLDILEPGQRLVGEWMAQAHGTKYTLPYGPFIAFDLMTGEKRAPFKVLSNHCQKWHLPQPKILHQAGALSVEKAMELLGQGNHGALDPCEGVVYRVERKGKFDFMAKWVKPDKIDGKYLPEMSGKEAVWNWKPE